MNLRLDKWLRAARIFKTRTQATKACSSGRVSVNGESAKPHRVPRLEDRIEIRFGDWTKVLIVKQLLDKPVSRQKALEMYLDLSPPRPRLDPLDRILQGAQVRREKGKGRPTKKERRQVDKLRPR